MSESKFTDTSKQLPVLPFSVTGAIGVVAGGVLFLNGIGMNTSSAIHQIYQVLNVAGGIQLIVLGGIAQHTKDNKKG